MEKHLQASVGYLELGMLVEADNEIECIPPEHKNSSAVLGVRLENLSCRREMDFDGSCGEGTLETPSRSRILE